MLHLARSPFSQLGKPAGRAIYFACINFFFFYFEQSYIKLYWTDFNDFFHQMKGICANVVNPVEFFRFLKGRCYGNQFCVRADLFARSRSISGSAGPIFTIFAPYGRYWIAHDNPTFFVRCLKGRCLGNQFCCKIVSKLPLPVHLSLSFRNTMG